METPKWVPIHKQGVGTELIPASKVVSVIVESTVNPEGAVAILSLRIRTTDDPGYRFVDRDQILAVAEVLGIMEALGGQSPYTALRQKLVDWRTRVSCNIVADLFPNDDYRTAARITAKNLDKILVVEFPE